MACLRPRSRGRSGPPGDPGEGRGGRVSSTYDASVWGWEAEAGKRPFVSQRARRCHSKGRGHTPPSRRLSIKRERRKESRSGSLTHWDTGRGSEALRQTGRDCEGDGQLARPRGRRAWAPDHRRLLPAASLRIRGLPAPQCFTRDTCHNRYYSARWRAAYSICDLTIK